MKKEIIGLIIKMAEYSAYKAVNKTSPWDHYQPKESEVVRNWAKKNSKK